MAPERLHEPLRGPIVTLKKSEELPVYMDPVEFSQLLAILHTLAPRRCLEWGSGGSTRAVLARCPFIEHYVSIEHHEQWFRKVRELVVDPRLSLHHVPANEPLVAAQPTQKEIEAWDARAEYEPAILADYVAFAKTDPVPYDFVLVDGRARRFCVQAGFELLTPGGVLVVHDAQREQYHDVLHALGRPVFLEPWKQGQICLMRKER